MGSVMHLVYAYAFVGLGFLLCDLARYVYAGRKLIAQRGLGGVYALCLWLGLTSSWLFYGVVWPVQLALKLRLVFAQLPVVEASEEGGD
jgi:hypothetical protein